MCTTPKRVPGDRKGCVGAETRACQGGVEGEGGLSAIKKKKKTAEPSKRMDRGRGKVQDGGKCQIGRHAELILLVRGPDGCTRACAA